MFSTYKYVVFKALGRHGQGGGGGGGLFMEEELGRRRLLMSRDLAASRLQTDRQTDSHIHTQT
jgi:hypothetical protein